MTDEEWSAGLARFAEMGTGEQRKFIWDLVMEMGRHMDRAAGAPADPSEWSPGQVEAFETAELWWNRAKVAMFLFHGLPED
jgi:hypothetical protein